MPAKIVVASGNAGKIKEIARLLAHLDAALVLQSELGVGNADETGKSFVDNALIKAHHAAAATGLPAIADDSGLCVDALDGGPGIYSARYSGVDATDKSNTEKLLAELEGVTEQERGAAFRCAACYVSPGEEPPIIAVGEWRGSILTAIRGDGGFGYDPVFLDPESGLSSAELSADEKNSRSHRGKALAGIARLLGERYSAS